MVGKLGVEVGIFVRGDQDRVVVRIRVVGMVIKAGHTCRVAYNIVLIFGIELCGFEFFTERVDLCVENFIDILHLLYHNLPVFGIWFGESSPNYIGYLRI